MKLLNKKQLALVTGASRNGGWEGYWGRSGGGFNKGHTTYGGQGGGFVGTNSCGIDLGNLIKNNTCASGVISGVLSGAPSLPVITRGAVIGSIAGMCYSDSNGGGRSNSGGDYGAQCTW